MAGGVREVNVTSCAGAQMLIARAAYASTHLKKISTQRKLRTRALLEYNEDVTQQPLILSISYRKKCKKLTLPKPNK